MRFGFGRSFLRRSLSHRRTAQVRRLMRRQALQPTRAVPDDGLSGRDGLRNGFGFDSAKDSVADSTTGSAIQAFGRFLRFSDSFASGTDAARRRFLAFPATGSDESSQWKTGFRLGDRSGFGHGFSGRRISVLKSGFIAIGIDCATNASANGNNFRFARRLFGRFGMSCEIYARFHGLFGPELRLRFRHRLRFRLGNGFRPRPRQRFGDDSDSKAVPPRQRFEQNPHPLRQQRPTAAAASGSKAETGPACASTANGRAISHRGRCDRNFGRSRLRRGLFRRIFADSRKSASAPKRTASYNFRSFSVPDPVRGPRAAGFPTVYDFRASGLLRTYFKSA